MSSVVEIIYWTVLTALAIVGSGALITAALCILEYIFEKGKRK